MVAKHLAVALLGSALMAAPALAQTSSGSGSTTSPSTGTAPTMNNTAGSSAAGSTMGAGSMTQIQPGQWLASKLEGLDVYNNNNEKIGDISEMLVDQSGKIQAVVVGVGGFLGIGERDVAIPFEQVKFMNEPRANAAATNTGAGGTAGSTAGNTTTGASPNTTGSVANTPAGGAGSNTAAANNADRSAPDHAVVNMTKDQLKSMPEFKYNR